MNQIIVLPKATKIIMALSIFIPLITSLFPHIIKHIYYDMHFLRSFQIHRLILSIFLCSFDINYILKLIGRYQIVSSMETRHLRIDNVETSVELLYFTLTLVIPLFFANLLEGVVTFSDSIDIAYVKLMSELVPRGSTIEFFSISVDSSYFVYYYFIYVLAISKLQSKCYYGLVYASCYVYFRRHLGGVPDIFVVFTKNIEKCIKRVCHGIANGKISVKPRIGRTVSSLKKDK